MANDNNTNTDTDTNTDTGHCGSTLKAVTATDTVPAYRIAFSALVVGAIFLGSAPIFMRLSEVGTSSAAFWRMAIATPILMIIWFFRFKKGQESSLTGKDFSISVIIGFFFAIDLFFWHWAVNETTVANATLLSNLAVVFTALFAFFILKTPLKRAFFIGLVIAVGGAVTLSGATAKLTPQYLFGDTLATITALAYSAYILSMTYARQRVSTLAVMAFSTLATTFFLLPAALVENAPFIPDTLSGWMPLLGLGLVTHILGQGLIAYGLAVVSAALGSMTLLIQPIIAAGIAWVLFGESLGPIQMLGAVLILSGLLLAKTKG